MVSRVGRPQLGPGGVETGLADLPLGIGESFEAVEKSFGASLESGQVEIARDKVLKPFLDHVEKVTGEKITPEHGLSDPIRGQFKGTRGGFVFGEPFKDTAEKFDVRIRELKEQFPALQAKSIADLNKEFIQEQKKQVAGDSRDKSVIGAVSAGIKALATDFPTAASVLIGGIGSALLKGATKGGIIALEATIGALSESAIQSQLEGTAQEKGLAIAGATLGPGVLRGLGITTKAATKMAGKGITKILKKSGNSTAKFIEESEKAIKGLSPEVQAAAKAELKALKPYGGRLDEAVIARTKQKLAFAEDLIVPDAGVQVKFKPTVPFKSTIKALDSAAVTKKAAANLKRFAERRASGGLAPREVLQELLLARPDIDADAALRDLDALLRGGQNIDTIINTRIASQSVPPLTSTGKFATNLEKVAAKKGGSPLKASIYDDLAEARSNLARLKKKEDSLANLQIFKTKDGKYAIVGNTDIKTLPNGGSYATREAAEEAIPRFAKKFGVDSDELSAVKTRFFSDKTGEAGATFKLALRASERDLKAFDLDLPGSVDESYLRLQTTAPSIASEAHKSIVDEGFEGIVKNQALDEPLDVAGRMDRLAVVDGASELGYKKLNAKVKNLQEVVKALKACNV